MLTRDTTIKRFVHDAVAEKKHPLSYKILIGMYGHLMHKTRVCLVTNAVTLLSLIVII